MAKAAVSPAIVSEIGKLVRRGAEAVLLAEFVTKQPGGFVQVVNQSCAFRPVLGDVVVYDDPSGGDPHGPY